MRTWLCHVDSHRSSGTEISRFTGNKLLNHLATSCEVSVAYILHLVKRRNYNWEYNLKPDMPLVKTQNISELRLEVTRIGKLTGYRSDLRVADKTLKNVNAEHNRSNAKFNQILYRNEEMEKQLGFHRRKRNHTRNTKNNASKQLYWKTKSTRVPKYIRTRIQVPIRNSQTPERPNFHLTPVSCINAQLQQVISTSIQSDGFLKDSQDLLIGVLKICKQFSALTPSYKIIECEYEMTNGTSNESNTGVQAASLVTPTVVNNLFLHSEGDSEPIMQQSGGDNLPYEETDDDIDEDIDKDEVIYAFSTSTVSSTVGRSLMIPMDTDSYEIKLDNCCSRTLSGHKSDFVKGTLVPKKLAIVGYNGEREYSTHQGTIRWYIDNDDGQAQELLIPNSLLVPTNETRLLSPQHLAQTMKRKETLPAGTRCTTYSDRMVLQWNDLQHTRTVPIDKRSANIGRIYSSPGYRTYNAYATRTVDDFPEPQLITCMRIEIQQTDEVLIDSDTDEVDGVPYEPAERMTDGTSKANICYKPKQLFVDNPTITPTEQREATTSTPEDELLRWHHRLAHVSMVRLQRMAQNGYLPSRIAHCRIPLCQACVYGKLTRKPWHSKPSTNTNANVITTTVPGQMVSVDQLESPIAGLVGQMKGILTKRRYKVATIFVDHFSNLSYVHLQSTTNAIETLEAKLEFERFASTFGIRIQHYHADNGRFAETLWKEDVRKHKQRLTFCGVGAHHQNGRAEKRIRDIQDMARTSLIHAQRRWPLAVNPHLWPYAIRHANHALNHTPFKGRIAHRLKNSVAWKYNQTWQHITHSDVRHMLLMAKSRVERKHRNGIVELASRSISVHQFNTPVLLG
jgi:GAG-pre-integrase domain